MSDIQEVSIQEHRYGGQSSVATSSKRKLNLTKDISTYLSQPVPGNSMPRLVDAFEYDPIMLRASKEGFTLKDYVLNDTDLAIKYAEGAVAAWEAALQEATLKGVLGENEVTRENVKLIELKITSARKDLDTVHRYSAMKVNNTDLRKDQLIEAMYKKAIEGNDLRAMMYLVDRIEGRVPEATQETYDYSNVHLVYEIVHTLFDKQLEVLNSGPGTRIVKCSRQSGKTHLASAMALMYCLREPDTPVYVIGSSMKHEEKLVDSAINQIVRQCDLRDSKGNVFNWRRMENRSSITVRGLSNTRDPDAIRGGRAKLIIIDEFFHMEDDLLEYLMLEILEPMQLKFGKEATKLFIGTPQKRKGTYGAYVWDNWKIPQFKWTIFDNPHIPDPEAFIDRVCSEKGITRDHPFIQREYLGLDVYESDWQLYPIYHTYDLEDEMPALDIDLITCGIDYGITASTALVCVAWDTSRRQGFIWREVKFTLAECATGESPLERLKAEVREAWPLAFSFFPQLSKHEANKFILWSADTNDKNSTVELAYNVTIDVPKAVEASIQVGGVQVGPDGRPILPQAEDAPILMETLNLNIADAHKMDKNLMHDKLRDILRTGALLLPHEGLTAEECDLTVLKKDAAGNIMADIDDKIYHPDILPALRYAMWWAVGKEVRG